MEENKEFKKKYIKDYYEQNKEIKKCGYEQNKEKSPNKRKTMFTIAYVVLVYEEAINQNTKKQKSI